MTIVVLGPPECGGEEVVRVLQRLGVHMGDLLNRRTLEDADFENIDRTILEVAGGNWGKPPVTAAVLEAVKDVPTIYALAMKQRNGLWGWYGTRTCLTIHAIHPFLENPHYIIVERTKDGIVSELCKIYGWRDNWRKLLDVYKARLDAFIDSVDVPILRLNHDVLTCDAELSALAVQTIAKFLGVEPGDAGSTIQLRKPVDWRTTTGAVLADSERRWLYDRSAELQNQMDRPVMLHVGVEYGGSLHCCRAGAPNARIIGVDLDISKCLGAAESGLELIKGNSSNIGYNKFFDKLDLCFIDGDHTYEYVKADLHSWAGKIRPGGILAFHDYGPPEWVKKKAPWVEGVKRAVDEWIWSPSTWEEIEGIDSIKAFRRLPLLRRGDGFGTIALGCPYYKAEYDFWRWFSWILVGGLQRGDQFINTQNVPGGVPIPMAHNALIREFLMTDRDTLVIIEDDHEGPQDILTQMREKPANWDFDIVCSTYVNRRGDVMAVGYYFEEEEPNEYGEYTCRMEPKNIWREGTQPYDKGGACFGLVFIRRWVLEAMHKATGNYKHVDTFWCDWNGRNSQDVVFYARANAVGARTGVDRDNEIIHWGKYPYTMKDYWRALAKEEKSGGSDQ